MINYNLFSKKSFFKKYINYFIDLIKKNELIYYKIKFLRYLISILIPAKLDIYIKWRYRLNKKLNLSNPITFNEKIQYLKLYWRDTLAVKCSDKIEVRKYVREKIGNKYLNEIIFIFNSPKEIKWEDLPSKFVIKLSHDSGSTIICKDKNKLNIKKVLHKINYHYLIKYNYLTKEWNYEGIKPKIIVEKYLGEVKDYKVFCFNGVPKLIQVDIDRFNNHTRNIYTPDWKWVDLSILYPNSKDNIEEKPSCLEEMLNLSAILAKPFFHVRVDWYICENCIKFSELTFFHGSGFEPFDDENWELIMGRWIKLPKRHQI